MSRTNVSPYSAIAASLENQTGGLFDRHEEPRDLRMGDVTVPLARPVLDTLRRDPRLPSTLPKRTDANRVGLRGVEGQHDLGQPFRGAETEIGSAALSVQISTNALVPACTAASARFFVPSTFVFTPSHGCCSSSGRCLCAAAWKTMSGRPRRTPARSARRRGYRRSRCRVRRAARVRRAPSAACGGRFVVIEDVQLPGANTSDLAAQLAADRTPGPRHQHHLAFDAGSRVGADDRRSSARATPRHGRRGGQTGARRALSSRGTRVRSGPRHRATQPAADLSATSGTRAGDRDDHHVDIERKRNRGKIASAPQTGQPSSRRRRSSSRNPTGVSPNSGASRRSRSDRASRARRHRRSGTVRLRPATRNHLGSATMSSPLVRDLRRGLSTASSTPR